MVPAFQRHEKDEGERVGSTAAWTGVEIGDGKDTRSVVHEDAEGDGEIVIKNTFLLLMAEKRCLEATRTIRRCACSAPAHDGEKLGSSGDRSFLKIQCYLVLESRKPVWMRHSD